MGPEKEPWRKYQNDLWHWLKHARPFLAPQIVIPAEIPGIESESEYLALAREICKKAAKGDSGTQFYIRLKTGEFVVWYQPVCLTEGLFLVVRDLNSHGELVTMFPPEGGEDYYQEDMARWGGDG